MTNTQPSWLAFKGGALILSVALLGACVATEPNSSSSSNNTSTGSSSSVNTVPSSSSSDGGSTSQPSQLNAAELYTAQCLDCHGDQNGIGDNGSGVLTYPNCEECDENNPSKLTAYLTEKMPLGKPEQCDKQCTAALTQYIFANFAGYSSNLTGQQHYQANHHN